MNSIDIDVGGTFTDLVLHFNGRALIKKAPTTPYDLSVCFSRVIEEGATELGLQIDELLPAIDMIRYSTTIAMNRLIERKGPRLGLITTEGHEDVRAHVLRVAGVRSDLRERTSSYQGFGRVVGVVHAVDPVMGGAGMIGVSFVGGLGNGGRLQVDGDVAHTFAATEKREAVEELGLVVFGVEPGELLHGRDVERVAFGLGAFAAVEDLDSGEVGPLAGIFDQCCPSLWCRREFVERCLAGWDVELVPDGMIVSHGLAPVRHDEGRVDLFGGLKGLRRVVVLEEVKEQETADEGGLRLK